MSVEWRNKEKKHNTMDSTQSAANASAHIPFFKIVLTGGVKKKKKIIIIITI